VTDHPDPNQGDQMGLISLNGRLLTVGSFSKVTKVALILRSFFVCETRVFILTKMG
jgi:hypothetical protein